MDLSSRLAFIIDEYEPHYMAFCAALQAVTGGHLYTCSPRLAQEYAAQYPGEVVVKANRAGISEELRRRGIRAVVFPGFHSAHYRALRPQMRFYQIHHGMSDKSEFHRNPGWDTCDVNFVAGEKLKQSIERYNRASVVVAGYLKTDKLIQQTINVPALRKRYRISDYERTILYAPTWDDSACKTFLSSLTKISPDQLIEAIPENWQLLVRPHPCLYRFSRRALEAWERAASRTSRVIFQSPLEAQQDDIVDLSTVCDVLITDVSAAAYEFLPSGKPLVFLDHSFVRPENKHIYQVGSVVPISEISRLRGALNDALINPPIPNREQFQRETLYQVDGKVGSRIAAYIEQDLSL